MVYLITCTCGRHKVLERTIRFFLDQDYEGEVIQLIYNNSPVQQVLGNFPLSGKKDILLVNKWIDRETLLPYKNTGAIFRDALGFIDLKDDDIVTHFDDDDVFLPWHVTEGVKGITEAITHNQKAYKPFYSYYWHRDGIDTVHNTMEPSIFVTGEAIKKHGYRQSTVDYHQGWLDLLIENKEILISKKGKPSFIYDWSGTSRGVHKISGADNNQKNFNDHQFFSRDEGDLILDPISIEEAQKYYNLILL